MKEEKREKERETALCSLDHGEKGQRRGAIREKESDMSLVQRYALVNSILLQT